MIGNIAFVFPGQGAQYPGMARELCVRCPDAMRVFEEAEDVLKRDIRRIAFEGPDAELNLTVNTQPCLLCAEVAAARALSAEEINASACAGLSIGEWSALVYADCLTFADAIRIVQYRAECMQQAVPEGEGGMAAIIGRSAEEVEALCARTSGTVTPANYNCPGQIAVSGKTEGIDSILELCAKEGITAMRLAVSIPSHCMLMENAARKLASVLESVEFRAPRVPIYMNVTGESVKDAATIKNNMVLQLTHPVRFEQALKNMLSDGFDVYAEVGPGKVLGGFVKRTAKANGVKPVQYNTDKFDELIGALK